MSLLISGLGNVEPSHLGDIKVVFPKSFDEKILDWFFNFNNPVKAKLDLAPSINLNDKIQDVRKKFKELNAQLKKLEHFKHGRLQLTGIGSKADVDAIKAQQKEIINQLKVLKDELKIQVQFYKKFPSALSVGQLKYGLEKIENMITWYEKGPTRVYIRQNDIDLWSQSADDFWNVEFIALKYL